MYKRRYVVKLEKFIRFLYALRILSANEVKKIQSNIDLYKKKGLEIKVENTVRKFF
jgi:hypothetical protein